MSSASKTQSRLLPGAKSAPEQSREIISDSIAAGLAFALILTVAQRVIGFGRGILFCRLMSDQQLGQWSMVWSYLMLLAPLSVLGLPGCFGKYTEHYHQRGQLKTFIYRIALISAVTTGGLSAAIFFLPETFSWILFRDASQTALVQWIAVALIVVTASNFLGSLMESLRQVKTVTLMRFITGMIFAGAGVGFIYFTSAGASAATAGFACACFVGMLPAVWVLWKYRHSIAGSNESLPHAEMWKKIAPFAIWLWAANLLNNLFEASDRYMLIHWSNTTADLAQGAVGQYHSGRVVPLLLVSIAAMLAGLLMPYMSKAWEANRKQDAQRQLNWTVKLVGITFTVGGALILLMSPILFDTILQGRYNDGLAVLPLTLVYCIWFSLYTVGQDYLWVAEKGKWAAVAIAIGLCINIGLNIALIPTMGLMGAVLATSCGNVGIVLLIFGLNHYFGCRTHLGIWLAALVPCLLLFGTLPACIATVFLMLACVTTELIFSNEEKREVIEFVRSVLKRD